MNENAKCHSCQGEIPGDFIGRRDSCPHCSADLHVCRNCRHYDPRAYNECREPQAERVVDKDRSNFCDYFLLAQLHASADSSSRDDALKKLDALFKK